jgi:hypothetical protein
VTGDGEGLVSRGGLVWLGEVADRSGLTAGLSGVLAEAPRRRHDPGVGLAQLVVALADGAECLSDLEALRGQPQLFGPVPSRTSAQRAFAALGPAELRRLAGARRDARAAVWGAGAGPAGDEATIDLDATIVRTKADKEDAAPTHKRTYGHHPHLAMCAETGEVLAGMFRPGNAGANCAADHVVVLAAAIDQLPADWHQGHQPGDNPALATKTLVARTDAAGPGASASPARSDAPPPRPSATGSSTSPPTPAPAASASTPPGPGPPISSTPSTASKPGSSHRHPPCQSGPPSTQGSDPDARLRRGCRCWGGW